MPIPIPSTVPVKIRMEASRASIVVNYSHLIELHLRTDDTAGAAELQDRLDAYVQTHYRKSQRAANG